MLNAVMIANQWDRFAHPNEVERCYLSLLGIMDKLKPDF
jgi:hypothetical protein